MKVLSIIIGVLLILVSFSELFRALSVIKGGHIGIWFGFIIMVAIGVWLIYYGLKRKK